MNTKACLLLAALLPLFSASGAPGDLNTAFGTGGKVITAISSDDDAITDMVAQPDGKILTCGTSLKFASSLPAKLVLARYLTTGALDSSFGSAGKVILSLGAPNIQDCALTLQPDGKVLVCAPYTSSVSTGIRFGLFRYNSNGTPDASFGTGGKVEVYFTATATASDDSYPLDVHVTPVGKIWVVGETDVNADTDIAIARFNSNGTLDTTFDGDGKKTIDLGYDDYAANFAVASDGGLAIAGHSFGGPNSQDFRVLRLDVDGNPVGSFGTNGLVYSAIGVADFPRDIIMQSDGKILVTGDSNSGGSRMVVVRYTTGGVLDSTFGTSGIARTYLGFTSSTSQGLGLALQADGSLYVTGYVDPSTGDRDMVVAKYSSSGVLDTTFDADGIVRVAMGADTSAEAMTISESGRITLGGWVYKPAGPDTDFALAQLEGVPAPDLSVEQPTGTTLTNGGNTVDYGTMIVGSAAVTKTFTLRNYGAQPLVLDSPSVTVIGPNASEFTLGTLPSGTLAVNGSAPFTVTFTPASPGVKTATLRIGSNDPDEDPFDVSLSANVSHPVTLDAAAYAVVEGSALTVKVRRQAAGGVVNMEVKTTNGTALAGSDYTALTVPTMVTFADGDTEKSVTINTTSDASVEPTETFTVSLGTGTATKGTPNTATVRIIDSNSTLTTGPGSDSVSPLAPTFTSPTATVPVPAVTNAPVMITGTATDARGVKSVEVSLDGFTTAGIPASLATPGATSTAFTAFVVPVGGSVSQPFTVSVRSFDFANNSSPQTPYPTRTFRVSRQLPLNLNPAQGSVTAGFYPTYAFKEPGSSVTITATPKPGFLFAGWLVGGTSVATGNDLSNSNHWGEIGVTAASLELPTLTFTMREGLSMVASFVPNSYLNNALAGSYNGHIETDVGYNPSNASEGYFTATVQNTGAFTAKLTVDGETLNVGGVFDINGTARFGTTRTTSVLVTRLNKPSIKLDSLTIYTSGSGGIRGHITQRYRSTITSESSITALRATVPADILTYVPVGTSATFTARIIPKAVQPVPLTTADFPQGYGYATITLTKTGLLTFTGTLSDGTTPVTMSSSLSENGECYLFAQLYNKLGFLSSTFFLDDTDPDSDMSCDSSLWLKPYQDIQHYPYGWPEVVNLSIEAARYVVTSGKSVITAPDDSVIPADVDGLADLLPGTGGSARFALELLSPEMNGGAVVAKYININGTDTVTKVNTADASFSVGIARTTGLVTGSFTNPDDNRKPSFKGLVYQKGATPGVYGFFLTPTPTPITYDGFGGSAFLRFDP